jgi:hypothetical protein
MSAEFAVTGDLRTTGVPGLAIGGQVGVGQSLHVANQLDLLDVLAVGLDAFVGSFAGDQPATIGRNLYTPNCGSKPAGVNVKGSCVPGAITVDQPCRCGDADLVKIQALVTHYSDPANNDNAAIGLDPAVYASPAAAARLELPCGYYYLTAINGASERVIGVHGRTAIFIGGSVDASAAITFTLTAGATLDVFVAGSVNATGEFHSGTPAYPAQSRFWVNGNVSMSANSILNGLFYCPKGTFTATSDLVMYGSIFANNYDGQSSTTIHFDRAAAQAGRECPATPPPSACGSVFGQACTVDTNCCQPLSCLPDHTCGYIVY